MNTIKDLELALAGCKGDSYVYVECGRYKPYTVATVRAAERRGYVVECKIRSSVYYVRPKLPIGE